MVKLHSDDEHALELIEEAIDVGGCPVVALLDNEDPDFVAARGRARDHRLRAASGRGERPRARSRSPSAGSPS